MVPAGHLLVIGERFTSTTNSFILTTVTHSERRRQLCIRYVCIIDQARGQDGWILAEFSFSVLMDRDEVVP